MRYRIEDPEPLLKLDSIHSGFAAGCEAGLCLAVGERNKGWAAPLVWALPAHLGQSPNRGRSPRDLEVLTAGQSPASHPAAKPQRRRLE